MHSAKFSKNGNALQRAKVSVTNKSIVVVLCSRNCCRESTEMWHCIGQPSWWVAHGWVWDEESDVLRAHSVWWSSQREAKNAWAERAVSNSQACRTDVHRHCADSVGRKDSLPGLCWMCRGVHFSIKRLTPNCTPKSGWNCREEKNRRCKTKTALQFLLCTMNGPKRHLFGPFIPGGHAIMKLK